ncbi:hypothetical protein [Methanobrevibacter sp.]|uniref:hypothetical protein n=1 Tax=Methanobrevibacter sp. TaxID=66852 RepID=UPI0038902F79
MFKKRYLLILLIILVIAVYGFVSISQMANPDGTNLNNNSKMAREVIANNSAEDLGTVEVIKNLGNPDSSKKIAYVVGVHPLENDTHKTLLKLLPQQTDLDYSYDIYVINVTEDFSSYGKLLPDDNPGRDTGQNLAYKYVYPKIVNGSYELAVDVHAHGGAYPYNTFVFSPVDGGLGESYGRNVSQSTENVSYYNPYQTTSGPYLTIPLNQHGVPAFYFEENSFISQDIKDRHMLELINGVDHLKL